jgi:DNA-3-methyladenine glycosylase
VSAARRGRAGLPPVVPRSFYEADVLVGAPALINKLLMRLDTGGRPVMAGRIVEVEAYRGSEDPASHAFRGPTARNAVMFGPPGHLYVYFTYGMHWCANAVFGPVGLGHAVLLRALAPELGLGAMREQRSSAAAARHGGDPAPLSDARLASGPARLCTAFGIDRSLDGADLVTGDQGLVVVDDGVPPPEVAGVSPRVGIRKAADRPWRWYVPGSPSVSRFTAAKPRPEPGRRSTPLTEPGPR